MGSSNFTHQKLVDIANLARESQDCIQGTECFSRIPKQAVILISKNFWKYREGNAFQNTINETKQKKKNN